MEEQRENQDPVSEKLRTEMEEMKKQIISGGGTWIWLKTKDGDMVTGMLCDSIAPSEVAGMDRPCLALKYAVRLAEVSTPMNVGGDMVIQSMYHPRPEHNADGNPVFIPRDMITRFRVIPANDPADQYIRLHFNSAIQAEIQKEMERKIRDMQGSGILTPSGVPANLPPQMIRQLESLPPEVRQQALRRMMGGM